MDKLDFFEMLDEGSIISLNNQYTGEYGGLDGDELVILKNKETKTSIGINIDQIGFVTVRLK